MPGSGLVWFWSGVVLAWCLAQIMVLVFFKDGLMN